MNVIFPQAPDKYTPAFFNMFFQTLKTFFTSVVNANQETPRIILRAVEDGTLWELTVDSPSGNLRTTQISSPPPTVRGV